MNDNELKSALFTDCVGKEFFESLAFFELSKCRIAFIEIFLGHLIAVLFRPIAAGPELCLDRISLDLLLRRDSRINYGVLLLLFCYICVHADLRCGADSSALMDSFCARFC